MFQEISVWLYQVACRIAQQRGNTGVDEVCEVGIRNYFDHFKGIRTDNGIATHKHAVGAS